MSANGNILHRLAVELGGTTSTALSNTMASLVKAKDEWSGAPVKLMFAIKETYSADKLNAIPTYGTSYKDGDNNPWLYTIVKPDVNGKEKEREVNFGNDWADATPIGLAVEQELDWCRRASNSKMTKAGIDEEWLEQYDNVPAIEKRIQYLTGKKGTIRTAYKNAIRLMQQLELVNELASVTAFVPPGSVPGEYENIVEVRSTVSGRENIDYEMFSIPTFLKLNVMKAAEDGGTFKALKATLTREKKPEDKTLKVEKIETPETNDLALAKVHQYMDQIFGSQPGDKYATFLKFLNGDKGQSAIETIGELHSYFGQILAMPKFGKMWSKYQEGLATKTDDTDDVAA